MKTEIFFRTSEYRDYISDLWVAYRYHKTEQNKLLYWAAGLFVAIGTASNLYGILLNKTVTFSYVDIILFHMAYVAIFSFYLHHQLGSFTYSFAATKAEEIYKIKYPQYNLNEQLPSRHDISQACMRPMKILFFGRWSMLCIGSSMILLGIYISIIFSHNHITLDFINVEEKGEISKYVIDKTNVSKWVDSFLKLGAVFIFPPFIPYAAYLLKKARAKKYISENLVLILKDPPKDVTNGGDK